MSAAKNLLNMFISEGLVDGQMMPQELPKLDGNLQQNKTTQTPGKLEIPKNQEPSVPQNKPEMPDALKKKEGEADSKTEGSDYESALEATSQCLALAEYHLGKLNKMKELEEIEDVNLDKLGAAHKIITDTKQALQEMLKKAGEKKSEKSDMKEDVEAEPVTQALSAHDFVQAGKRRIDLKNEKFTKSKKNITLHLREIMAPSLEKEAGNVPLVFFIDGIYYKVSNKINEKQLFLTPWERQATAGSIASDLNSKDRFTVGVKRLQNLA